MYHTLKYVLVFLILGSALLINPFFTSEYFEFPKFLLFLVVVGGFGVMAVLDFTFNKTKKSFSPGKVVMGFAGLLLLGNLLGYFFSGNKAVSLIGSYLRHQGLLTNMHYLILATGAFYYFKRYKEKADLSNWLIFGVVAVCFVAILPIFSSFAYFSPALFYDRAYGTFGNPNYLASFIVALLPFLALSSRIPRILKWIGLAIVLFTLFLTGSRSAWIAIILAFLFFGAMEAYFRKYYKVLVGGIVAVLVLVGIGFYQNMADTSSFSRLSVKSDDLLSANTRFELWEAGTKLFLDSPITGYGQDLVQGNIEKHLPDYLKSNSAFFVDRSHSEFIDMAVTTGVFGFIGYLGLILSVFFMGIRALYKKKLSNRTAMIAALMGFSALNLYNAVNFSTISTNVLLYLLIGFILGMARE